MHERHLALAGRNSVRARKRETVGLIVRHPIRSWWAVGNSDLELTLQQTCPAGQKLPESKRRTPTKKSEWLRPDCFIGKRDVTRSASLDPDAGGHSSTGFSCSNVPQHLSRRQAVAHLRPHEPQALPSADHVTQIAEAPVEDPVLVGFAIANSIAVSR